MYQQLFKSTEGKNGTEYYYSVMATLISLFLPTYILVEKTDDGSLRYYARIQEYLERSTKFRDSNDQIRISVATWSLINSLMKTFVCFPAPSEYTNDVAKLAWLPVDLHSSSNRGRGKNYCTAPPELVYYFEKFVGPPLRWF